MAQQTVQARDEFAPRHVAPAERRDRLARHLLVELPDRLPVILGCLALPALGATLVGQFRPFVVLPAWAVFGALTWRLVPAAPHGSRPGPILGLLGVVGAWSAWGVAASGEYVVVNRDPGFLTLKAWWLAGHPSARIPVGSALQATVGGASAQTDGFSLRGDSLLAQGNSTVPSVLATVGWAGGPAAVVWANVLIGAVAIVAVYAVARRLVGPGWSLLAATGVAVTLPMLAFTRTAYTEPLVLALTFGGVAVLIGARERPSAGTFALAGGMVGAAAAARIDGAMVTDGAALALACVVLAAPRPEERARLARYAAVALGVTGLVASLGLVDLIVLSPDYLRGLGRQFLLLLGGSAVLLAAVAVVLDSRLRDALRGVIARNLPRLALAAQVLVVVAFAVLVTRPLWMTAHGTAPGTPTAVAVGLQQAAEGLAVDGTRTYGEQTITWLAWYLGWPIVLAAAVGAVLLVRRIVHRHDVAGAVLACVAVAGSAVYLVAPAITPDQIWAVRRLLPVALPVVVILAVLAVAAAWGCRTWPWRVPAALLAVGMLLFPATTWFPVAAHGELDGQLQLAQETCAAIQSTGAQRVVWVRSAPWGYLATLRVICGVDVVEFTQPPSPVQLAAIDDAWGDQPVVVMALEAEDLGFGAQVSPFAPEVTSSEWARRIAGPPASIVTRKQALWAGLLGTGGTLTPLTPAG